MSAAGSPSSKSGSLPPLGGGLLASYLIAWFGLATIAVGLSLWSILDPVAAIPILALRLAKSAILISVSAILLKRRRTDPVTALLALAFLLWSITSSFDFTGSAMSLPILLDRVRFLLFAGALLLFPNADWRPGWTRHVAVASVGVCLLGIAESLGLIATNLFLPLAITCVLAAIAALILRFRTASSQTERQQLKWVALGLVAGVGLILTARAGAALVPPSGTASWHPIVLEALFQLGVIVVALGFFVSLLRYRLFDAEAAITQSAAYAALTLTLVGTFAGSEALIETLGQRYFGEGIGDVSAGIAAAIAAILITPLHDRTLKWAERHFERDLAQLKEQLPELIAELSAGSSTSALAGAILPKIQDAVHATQAALIVEGTILAARGTDRRSIRTWMKQARADRAELFDRDPGDALFPVRMLLRCPFGTVRGQLLLGPRPDGSLYGAHELAALGVIAPALRQGLFSTKRRDDEKARERREFEAMQRRIDELSAMVAQVAGEPTPMPFMHRRPM